MIRFKRSGAGHLGYPIKQTTTMQAEGHTFTVSSEVVERASTPLEASLFEMPAGCTVVSSYQELMGTDGMMGAMKSPAKTKKSTTEDTEEHRGA